MNPRQFQQQLQQSLAIHPFNPQTLVDQATRGFIHLILIGFDWIYLVAELGVLFCICQLKSTPHSHLKLLHFAKKKQVM